MRASVAVAMFVLVSPAAARAGSEPLEPGGPGERERVVIVCAHGNVKSLIASGWFNRLAAEQGIPVRAIARGLTPENPVPQAIGERLRREGIDVSGYEAHALTRADVEGASRLVLIGVEAPPWVGQSGVKVETWDGIPPASERYEEARDAMRTRIEMLLGSLRGTKPRR